HTSGARHGAWTVTTSAPLRHDGTGWSCPPRPGHRRTRPVPGTRTEPPGRERKLVPPGHGASGHVRCQAPCLDRHDLRAVVSREPSARTQALHSAAVLSGKRIFVTGGAGFTATTLARTLVDENELVALDNLHRDALSATDLSDHPNFTFHQADVLDA